LAPAGSDGLLTVLDWLAPTDHPARKGMMLGFDARHTRGHLYRSIMEAIALTMRGHIVAMMTELDTPLQGLVISGGGANSELFMSIFASALGVPASRATGASGAGLGAAMCAAAAVGVHPSIDAAAQAMCSDRQTFQPDSASTARYDAVAPHFASIRDRTDSLFESTYPIFHD
jgi:sugar (pentulose or hexulose) kinase